MNEHYIIIGGTFKSGTSSLFSYLSLVDGINPSSKKETGFFVPARYNAPLPEISSYHAFFKTNDSGIRLEASPGYLYGKELIAKAIQEKLGEKVKIVFLLREPTSRFITFYKMMNSGFLKDLNIDISNCDFTLREFYEKCLNHIPETEYKYEKNDYVLNGLYDGCYVKYLESWFEIFGKENVKIIFFEELSENPDKVCLDILSWAGHEGADLSKVDFRIVNNAKAHKNEFVRKLARKINSKFEKSLRQSPKLKSRLIRVYNKINVDRNKKEEFDTSLVSSINEFYQPYNEELSRFLQAKEYTEFPKWLHQ